MFARSLVSLPLLPSLTFYPPLLLIIPLPTPHSPPLPSLLLQRRRYLLVDRAIEIFFRTKQSSLLIFTTTAVRETVLAQLLEKCSPLSRPVPLPPSPSSSVSSISLGMSHTAVALDPLTALYVHFSIFLWTDFEFRPVVEKQPLNLRLLPKYLPTMSKYSMLALIFAYVSQVVRGSDYKLRLPDVSEYACGAVE